MPLAGVCRLLGAFLRDMKFNIVRGVDEIKSFLNNALTGGTAFQPIGDHHAGACLTSIGKGKGKLSLRPIIYYFSGAKKMVPLQRSLVPTVALPL